MAMDRIDTPSKDEKKHLVFNILFLSEVGIFNFFTAMEISHKKSHKDITGFIPVHLRGFINIFEKLY
jgi:hypothetical protein